MNFKRKIVSHGISTFKVNVVAALLFFGVAVNASPNSETAKNQFQSGKIMEAALTATQGCSKLDKDSCILLCTMGTIQRMPQWQEVGCGLGCGLGEASACVVQAGSYVKANNKVEAIRMYQKACELGDSISCNMAKTFREIK